MAYLSFIEGRKIFTRGYKVSITTNRQTTPTPLRIVTTYKDAELLDLPLSCMPISSPTLSSRLPRLLSRSKFGSKIVEATISNHVNNIAIRRILFHTQGVEQQPGRTPRVLVGPAQYGCFPGFHSLFPGLFRFLSGLSSIMVWHVFPWFYTFSCFLFSLWPFWVIQFSCFSFQVLFLPLFSF